MPTDLEVPSDDGSSAYRVGNRNRLSRSTDIVQRVLNNPALSCFGRKANLTEVQRRFGTVVALLTLEEEHEREYQRENGRLFRFAWLSHIFGSRQNTVVIRAGSDSTGSEKHTRKSFWSDLNATNIASVLSVVLIGASILITNEKGSWQGTAKARQETIKTLTAQITEKDQKIEDLLTDIAGIQRDLGKAEGVAEEIKAREKALANRLEAMLKKHQTARKKESTIAAVTQQPGSGNSSATAQQ